MITNRFLKAGFYDFLQYLRLNWTHEYDEWYTNRHDNRMVDEGVVIDEYLKSE